MPSYPTTYPLWIINIRWAWVLWRRASSCWQEMLKHFCWASVCGGTIVLCIKLLRVNYQNGTGMLYSILLDSLPRLWRSTCESERNPFLLLTFLLYTYHIWIYTLLFFRYHSEDERRTWTWVLVRIAATYMLQFFKKK